MSARAGVSRFGDGQSTLDQRIGQQGDQIVSELHGRYYEQSIRKNTFFALSKARATSLGATSQVGLIVYNPPDSGVNLSLTKWTAAIVATSAALTGLVLGIGYQPTTPTSVTVADATGQTFGVMQSPTVFNVGKARAYAIATLLFAPLDAWLLMHNTAAINTVGVDVASGDLEGMFTIPPGGLATIQALGAAAAASGVTCSLAWEEVPTL
jgi:hypothetical protein